MTSRLATAALLLALAAPAFAGGRTEARQHFVDGLEAAQRGDYTLAIGQFLASFEAFPHPTTAFNIAKAYEDKGDLKRALLWYERFMELAPSRASEAAEPVLRIREALDPVPSGRAPAPEAKRADDKPSLDEVLQQLGSTPAAKPDRDTDTDAPQP